MSIVAVNKVVSSLLTGFFFVVSALLSSDTFAALSENKIMAVVGDRAVSSRDLSVAYSILKPNQFYRKNNFVLSKAEMLNFLQDYTGYVISEQENEVFQSVAVSDEEVADVYRILKKIYGKKFDNFMLYFHLDKELFKAFLRRDLVFKKMRKDQSQPEAWLKELKSRYRVLYFE